MHAEKVLETSTGERRAQPHAAAPLGYPVRLLMIRALQLRFFIACRADGEIVTRAGLQRAAPHRPALLCGLCTQNQSMALHFGEPVPLNASYGAAAAAHAARPRGPGRVCVSFHQLRSLRGVALQLQRVQRERRHRHARRPRPRGPGRARPGCPASPAHIAAALCPRPRYHLRFRGHKQSP